MKIKTQVVIGGNKLDRLVSQALYNHLQIQYDWLRELNDDPEASEEDVSDTLELIQSLTHCWEYFGGQQP
jgi:hypothetical protein